MEDSTKLVPKTLIEGFAKRDYLPVSEAARTSQRLAPKGRSGDACDCPSDDCDDCNDCDCEPRR